MEQPSSPDNARQSRGLARFWPVHGMPAPAQRQDQEQEQDEAEQSGSADSGSSPEQANDSGPAAVPHPALTNVTQMNETQMVALGSRRAPAPDQRGGPWNGFPPADSGFPPPESERSQRTAEAPRHGGAPVPSGSAPVSGNPMPRSPFAPTTFTADSAGQTSRSPFAPNGPAASAAEPSSGTPSPFAPAAPFAPGSAPGPGSFGSGPAEDSQTAGRPIVRPATPAPGAARFAMGPVPAAPAQQEAPGGEPEAQSEGAPDYRGGRSQRDDDPAEQSRYGDGRPAHIGRAETPGRTDAPAPASPGVHDPSTVNSQTDVNGQTDVSSQTDVNDRADANGQPSAGGRFEVSNRGEANGRAYVNGRPGSAGRPAAGWASVPTSGIPTISGNAAAPSSPGPAPAGAPHGEYADGGSAFAGPGVGEPASGSAADRRFADGSELVAQGHDLGAPGRGGPAAPGLDGSGFDGSSSSDAGVPGAAGGRSVMDPASAGVAGPPASAEPVESPWAGDGVRRDDLHGERPAGDGLHGEGVHGEGLSGRAAFRQSVLDQEAPTTGRRSREDGASSPIPAPRRLASLEDADAVTPRTRGRRAAPESNAAADGAAEANDAAQPTEAQPRSADPGAGPMRPGDINQSKIAFWDDEATKHFQTEWHEVKANFVDDPVTALTRAHDLITDAVNELTESLLAERDELDPLRTTSNPDTESMRMAMRGYRDFLERILAL
jgi:hypothetical protein